MTLKETLKELKALGNAKVRAQNAKNSAFGKGAGDNQFGVSLGDIRVLAKKIRTDHELALSLWETGNVDAQLLATLLIQPKKLSAKEKGNDFVAYLTVNPVKSPRVDPRALVGWLKANQ